MGSYFRIFKDSAGEFRFNLHAPNNEKILHSEGYAQKQSCLNGIASVKVNAPDRNNFDSFTDSAGKFRFRLRARNNEIIGTSEAYVTPQGRDNGIVAVMQYAPSATIEDITV